MQKTGYTDLPLHYGHTPRWLFRRMVKLSGAIVTAIVEEHGPDEVLRRVADPFWFQSFACTIGFDWHSSGSSTTACGALKLGMPANTGLYIAGGKGKASKKAPEEIVKAAERFGLDYTQLVQASKLSAKVDNNCVQDGYQLYHHSFFLAENGKWAVVQQGMNSTNNLARRYHWLSEGLQSYVVEPQAAICGIKENKVLNLTAREHDELRKMSVELVNSNPIKLERDILQLPREHKIRVGPATLKTLQKLAQLQPTDYQSLVSTPGVGAAALRALALTAAVIYGSPVSWRDPVGFSFAHGGKDGTPFKVNRKLYDSTIRTLTTAIEQAKLGNFEKKFALKRLAVASLAVEG